jgi:hypothetical protein
MVGVFGQNVSTDMVKSPRLGVAAGTQWRQMFATMKAAPILFVGGIALFSVLVLVASISHEFWALYRNRCLRCHTYF